MSGRESMVGNCPVGRHPVGRPPRPVSFYFFVIFKITLFYERVRYLFCSTRWTVAEEPESFSWFCLRSLFWFVGLAQVSGGRSTSTTTEKRIEISSKRHMRG